MFKGQKTYLAAALMLVHAVSSYFIGDMDLNAAIHSGIEAIAIICLRLGIKAPS